MNRPPAHPANEDHGPESTASDLMNDAKRMDPNAWKTLVERYSWLIRQWCHRSGLSGENADDVVQNVLGQVALYLPSFQFDGKRASFRRWLRTVTRTQIAEFHRNNARHPQAAGGTTANVWIVQIPQPDESSVDSSDSGGGADLQFEQVWEIVERLGDEFAGPTWQAFWATAVENRTSAEVGRALGMTANAVRLAKARVIQRFRTEAALSNVDLHRLSK